MKWWGWVSVVALVLAAGLGLAWLNRFTILPMVAHARLPHVAPNMR